MTSPFQRSRRPCPGQWRALSGDYPPLFAAVAAIVCLAPGVASHGRQAVGMLIGVAIGIAVGELAGSLPIDSLLRIALVTPVAMLAAASFGLNAVMVIQAGASAVIVVASNQSGTGFERIADAAISGCVGLLFSQVLFTPDPVKLVERAGARLEEAIRRAGAAETRAAASALDDAIASAKSMTRWTLRGRWQAERIATATGRWQGFLDQSPLSPPNRGRGKRSMS